MEAAENVLNLLDSHWYDLNFFNRPKPTKINNVPETPFSENSNLIIPTLPIIHTKSSPNPKLSEFSESPNSVLPSPKLQTIFSGKESGNFDDPKSESAEGNLVISHSRRKKRLSKSLSDLEFEELKGFMDLGFVFSEDDKDSILASIIPGLQRLENLNHNHNINHNNNSNNSVVNNVVNDEKKASKCEVNRPYLSETWQVLEKKKNKKKTVINWKVPANNSQIDMKGYLKSWAHNVASTVKL